MGAKTDQVTGCGEQGFGASIGGAKMKQDAEIPAGCARSGMVAAFHSSSVTRSALPRRAIAGLIAAFTSFALPLCGVVLADSVETNFESFTVCHPPAPVFAAACTVNGQDGWKSALPNQVGGELTLGYDQQVVNNGELYRYPGTHPAPASFGTQSLRLSNAYNPNENSYPPEFEGQTYSKPTKEAAGENLANTEYTAQFSFISVTPNARQPGLRIYVQPSEGHGGRMSYIGLRDEPDGIHVIFYEVVEGNWVEYPLRGYGEEGPVETPEVQPPLTRDQPHTIKFWMRLVPGPNNDLVRISIDGRDVGQCFTTWESYYEDDEHKPVPVSDRLLFLSGNRNGNEPSLIGGGYLFDNVTTTTAKGAGPPTCELPIEKQAETRTARPGDRVRYRISVRNRGRLAASDVLMCDRIPRQLTFVSADRKLLRLGSRRCLLIPRLAPGQRVTFHPVFRVNANASPGSLTNVIEQIPGVKPPIAESPRLASPLAALPAGAKVVPAPPVQTAKAVVRILAKRTTPRPPPVTG
jgi:uncharacterized repeat protein (TIGR01451 family)